MIEKFTESLPSQLALDIRAQYERSLPIYTSYIDSPDSHYTALKLDKNFDYFMLALAIFYTSVIVPLREAGTCFTDFRGYENVENIKIGNQYLSQNSTRSIHLMYSEILRILNKYGLSEQVLLFSDLKDFARNLNSYIAVNSHEN